MTIKEAEERTGLSRSHIRFYEREGLVKPQRNAENRYRDYSERDVRELQKVAWLRTLGISVEDIRRLAAGEADLYEVVQGQLPLLERQISELQNARRMCERLLAWGEISYEDLEISRYVDDPGEYWQENRRILVPDSVGFVFFWGGRAVWLWIAAVSLLLSLAALFFLPERIPVQWSGGEAVSFAGRWTVLAYPAACAAVRFLLRPVIEEWVRHRAVYGAVISDYVANCLCFAALSVEIFMFLFVGGIVHSVAAVLLAEAVLLAGFLGFALRELSEGFRCGGFWE